MSPEGELTDRPPLDACGSFTRRVPQPENRINDRGNSSIQYFLV